MQELELAGGTSLGWFRRAELLFALRALQGVPSRSQQLIWRNLVSAERARSGQIEVEAGLGHSAILANKRRKAVRRVFAEVS